MIETLSHPEAEQSAEYNKQTPEQFIESLTLFDSYKPVPENVEPTPEQQMPFTKDEQEIAAAIRSTLEELARNADESEAYVSIPEIFTTFEEMIRNSDADEETKDQLFLVATKMRYHLQLRYDKTKDGEPVSKSAPTTEELFDAAQRGDRRAHREYVSAALRDILNSPIGPQLRDAYMSAQSRGSEWREWESTHQAAGKPNFNSTGERNYTSEARDIINQYTGGVDYKNLDKKTQGKINRDIARNYHPDLGGDEELYKAINAETDTKNSPDNDTRNNSTDTESY